MTGHYEIFFFSAKFAQDLGVIKTNIVSLKKKLFLLSLLVSIARAGFSLFSENDLAGHSLENASGFFQR